MTRQVTNTKCSTLLLLVVYLISKEVDVLDDKILFLILPRCLATNAESSMRELMRTDHDLQTHLNLIRDSGGSHEHDFLKHFF